MRIEDENGKEGGYFSEVLSGVLTELDRYGTTFSDGFLFQRHGGACARIFSVQGLSFDVIDVLARFVRGVSRATLRYEVDKERSQAGQQKQQQQSGSSSRLSVATTATNLGLSVDLLVFGDSLMPLRGATVMRFLGRSAAPIFRCWSEPKTVALASFERWCSRAYFTYLYIPIGWCWLGRWVREGREDIPGHSAFKLEADTNQKV